MKTPSLTQTMFRESLLYLFANLAGRAAGFIMIPFYSAYLTPAEYGSLELIELAAQVVSLIVGLGLFGGALSRVYQDFTDPLQQKRVASTAVFASLLANLGGVLLALSLAPSISMVFFGSGRLTGLLRYMFAAMFFGNLIEVCLCFVRLQGRAALFTAYSLITLLLTLGLNIYFIAGLRRGVMGFVLSKLLVTSAGSAVLLTWTLRRAGFHWNAAVVGKMVRFGAPLIVANGAFFLLHFGDRFFLSRFCTLEDVGNYSLAYKFGFLVTFLVGEPFGRAWGVRYVTFLRELDWQDKFRDAACYLCFSLTLAGLAIALFSDEVMHFLVTPGYYRAFSIIPWIVAAYVIREMGDFFRNILYIKLRSSLVGAVGAAAALLNFALNFLLVPAFGMMGAALATLATWSAYALGMYYFAERSLPVHFPVRRLAAFAALGLIAGVAGVSVNSLPLLWRFPADGALLLAFIMLVWMLGVFTSDQRNFVRARLRDGRAALGAAARLRVGP